jgi:hypothetical protein
MSMLCPQRTILSLIGQASRTLFPYLAVRPSIRGRGVLTLRRYTSDGLAAEADVLVSDLVALETAGRIKLHRGPVRRQQQRAGQSGFVAFRQIVLAWAPRWGQSAHSLRMAEAQAVPWVRR